MNDLNWFIERVWAKVHPVTGVLFAVECQRIRNSSKTHMSTWEASPTAALDGLILKIHAEESLGLDTSSPESVSA
jgi:hypothetical protein